MHFLLSFNQMKPHFLFPASPLNSRMIDEAFQDQAIVLKSAGFGTSVFDIDNNKIIGAQPEPGAVFVYRGWMMTPEEYSFFYGWLLGRQTGNQTGLITNPEQYLAAHYLPNWYPLVEALTPETLIFPGRDMVAWKTTVAEGWDKIHVKDYVKSLSTGRGSIARSGAGQVPPPVRGCRPP